MRNRVAHDRKFWRYAQWLKRQHGDGGAAARVIGRRVDDTLRSRMLGRHDVRLGNEAEPPTMNGADDALPRAVVADRLTYRADPAGNAGVGHIMTQPDGGHDLVFRHQAIAVSDKMDQHGKHLRLQPHRFNAAAELEALRIEPEISECPSHAPS